MLELILPAFIGGILNSLTYSSVWFSLFILIVTTVIFFFKKNFFVLPALFIMLMFLYKTLNPFEGCFFSTSCPKGAIQLAIISFGSPLHLILIFILGEMLVPLLIALSGKVFFKHFYNNRAIF